MKNPKITLVQAYKMAWEFDQAARILEKHSSLTTYGSTPHIVCQAFALEVYLKCLHMLDHPADLQAGRLLRGHDLVSLFARQTADSQAAIRQHFAETVKELPEAFREDLDNILKMVKNAFVVWRYGYENDNPAQFIGVEAVVAAVRRTIFAKEPGFENWPRSDYA